MDNTIKEYVIKNLKDHPIQSFSYIEQNQICSSFTIITSQIHHITLHAYTHTHALCSNFDRLSILHQKNKGSRSFLFRIRIYPRIQLNMKAFPKRVAFKNLLNQTNQTNLPLHPLPLDHQLLSPKQAVLELVLPALLTICRKL